MKNRILERVYLDTFSVDAGTFGGKEFFMIGNDTERVKKIMNMDILHAEGITFGDSVWILDGRDKATVNHELFHLTKYVLEYYGIFLNDSTEELYAYQLGYFTEKFYEKYKNDR
jgi:hypothetical protein